MMDPWHERSGGEEVADGGFEDVSLTENCFQCDALLPLIRRGARYKKCATRISNYKT